MEDSADYSATNYDPINYDPKNAETESNDDKKISSENSSRVCFKKKAKKKNLEIFKNFEFKAKFFRFFFS